MPVTVRRLGSDDWQLLRQVRLRALAEAPYAFGSTYAAEACREADWWAQSAARLAWFVALTGNPVPVGLVAGVPAATPAGPPQLISMWVDPAWRGRRVAVALLDGVERWARACGATALVLRVSDRNVRARRFYARHGFTATGDDEQLRSDPSAMALGMSRQLPTARLRFAPSSARPLHAGHVRSAVLTRVLSSQLSGHYFVRVEDTHLPELDAAARDGVIRDLAWLGLVGDEPPRQQHRLTHAHRTALVRLADGGHTYRDGEAVRFRLPRGGVVRWDDIALGPVGVSRTDLRDPVLVRGDGTPTFVLASTVDDAADAVTHLVRVDSMLRATAAQREVWQALGCAQPATAHIPALRSRDGTPLRARSNASAVAAFRQLGVRPDAVLLYLAMPQTASWKVPPQGLASIIDRIDLRQLPRRPYVFDIDSLALLAHRLDRLDAPASGEGSAPPTTVAPEE